MKPKVLCCEICGEVKPRDSFYKYRCYAEGIPPKAVWCKECRKLHFEMIKTEKSAKLLEKTVAFTLSFN